MHCGNVDISEMMTAFYIVVEPVQQSFADFTLSSCSLPSVWALPEMASKSILLTPTPSPLHLLKLCLLCSTSLLFLRDSSFPQFCTGSFTGTSTMVTTRSVSYNACAPFQTGHLRHLHLGVHLILHGAQSIVSFRQAPVLLIHLPLCKTPLSCRQEKPTADLITGKWHSPLYTMSWETWDMWHCPQAGLQLNCQALTSIPTSFPPSLSPRRWIRFISPSSSSGHLTKFSTWRSWWRRRRWPIARDWWWRVVHGGQPARRSWGRTRPSCIHNGLQNRKESYVHRTEQSTNTSKKWQPKEAVLISCQLAHHQVPRGQHQRQNLYPYFEYHL